MDRKDFVERLKSLIEELSEGNKSRFAASLGLHSSYMDRWLNKGHLPSAEHMDNMRDILDVNINWLLSGKGPRYLTTRKRKRSDKG
ncbi:MAG: helix-turn-helix transcriptional regulator [Deltaproteobacteria bacterium]|nr:helix-turn-helix transcriptional regulator [Deltaproteobacteria bacterium]